MPSPNWTKSKDQETLTASSMPGGRIHPGADRNFSEQTNAGCRKDILPFLKNNKNGAYNQHKANEIIPLQFFFEIDDRENGKNN
jgi:hypothetical protein